MAAPTRNQRQQALDAKERGRLLGAWDAYDRVLNHLNTLDARLVDKNDLYAAIMAMRP